MIGNLIPPQYRVAAKILALAGALVVAFAAGREWRDRSCDIDALTLQADLAAEREQNLKHRQSIERLRNQVTVEAGKAWIARQKIIKLESDITAQEVDRYETRPDADDRCLDSEWLRVVDNATGAPRVPEPTAEPDGSAPGAPADIGKAQALRVITENYRLCLSEFERFAALQKWVMDQYNVEK